MRSTENLTQKKRKKTPLEMAVEHGLSADEYIQIYGYPYHIKYKGARDDN